MKAKFEMDGGDLVCVQIDDVPQNLKLGEVFYGRLEFEVIDFLNEIYSTDKVSDELLALARAWYETTGRHP